MKELVCVVVKASLISEGSSIRVFCPLQFVSNINNSIDNIYNNYK